MLRIPSGIAGVFLCLLAAAGVLEIRLVSPNSASAFNERARSEPAQTVVHYGGRASCSECGYVVSSQHVAGSVAGATREITVRFRDGSTTVFNDADGRPWRVGSRVVVIR
jgi:hypothetical protein